MMPGRALFWRPMVNRRDSIIQYKRRDHSMQIGHSEASKSSAISIWDCINKRSYTRQAA